MIRLIFALFVTFALSGTALAGSYTVEGKSRAISPVSNPIFFEDPRIRTEARLIFLYNRVSDDFGLNLGGTQVNLGKANDSPRQTRARVLEATLILSEGSRLIHSCAR